MSSDGVPTIATLTTKVQELNRAIRALEVDLATKGEEAADAEGAYRAQYAYQLRQQREAGSTVAEAEAYAKAEVAVLSRARDVKAHEVKVIFEKIEDRRGERASLHRLIDAVGGGS